MMLFDRGINIQIRVIYSLFLVLRSLFPTTIVRRIWDGMAWHELTITTTKMITDNSSLSHIKYFSDTIQNCEEIIFSPLFRYSFRRATILFSKIVLLHLLLISSMSPVEFYTKIVWLPLSTALAWEACYETRTLNHTVHCFSLSSWKCMMKN